MRSDRFLVAQCRKQLEGTLILGAVLSWATAPGRAAQGKLVLEEGPDLERFTRFHIN